MPTALHEKKTPIHLPGYENISIDPQWDASNAALDGLLAQYRMILEAPIAMAKKVARGIEELAPLMAALCRRTCRFCPEPCCITNTIWFDFQDLLLFHLLDAPIPPCQAVSDLMEACPFLSRHGCRLPPLIRPWKCIQYLCPAQLVILDKQGPSAHDLLEKIKTIQKQRSRMEAAFDRCIRNRRKEKGTAAGSRKKGI